MKDDRTFLFACGTEKGICARSKSKTDICYSCHWKEIEKWRRIERRTFKAKFGTHLTKWVQKNWGDRCPDYVKGCACCKAWKSVDYLLGV